MQVINTYFELETMAIISIACLGFAHGLAFAIIYNYIKGIIERERGNKGDIASQYDKLAQKRRNENNDALFNLSSKEYDNE